MLLTNSCSTTIPTTDGRAEHRRDRHALAQEHDPERDGEQRRGGREHGTHRHTRVLQDRVLQIAE
jgi:hypothetical protein